MEFYWKLDSGSRNSCGTPNLTRFIHGGIRAGWGVGRGEQPWLEAEALGDSIACRPRGIR